jgi:hypothetical protein
MFDCGIACGRRRKKGRLCHLELAAILMLSFLMYLYLRGGPPGSPQRVARNFLGALRPSSAAAHGSIFPPSRSGGEVQKKGQIAVPTQRGQIRAGPEMISLAASTSPISPYKLWQRQRLIELPFLFPSRSKDPILFPFAVLVPEDLATPSVPPVHLSQEPADPYPCHRPVHAIATGVHHIESLPRSGAHGHGGKHYARPLGQYGRLHPG